MKEIVLFHPFDFQFRQTYVPEIETNEMLVKVAYCAICATDIRILEGKKKRDVTYPRVIGHEISGVICDIGDGVTGYQTGDRVSISPIIPCGHCRNCLSGRENLCENRLSIGYQYDGGYAEYVKIPAPAIKSGNVLKISDHLSLEESALVEPLACCINSIKKADLDINDNVLIVGAGAIGQFHLQLCRLYGANYVAVSDPLENRREMAGRFGASLVVNPEKEDIAELASRDGIRQFNKIIFACAATSEVNHILNLCARGGSMILFSGFSGTGLCSVTLNTIHYNEIKLMGSSGYKRSDYRAALSLLENGNIDVKPLISDIYPLEKFQEAYEKHKSGKGFKILIQP